LLLLALIIISENQASERVSFCAVGDVLLDRGIRRIITAHDVDHPFAHIADFIDQFDIAFCNLECPVSARGKSTGKVYCFRADTGFFNGVKNAGFNLFSLANNHIIDWGETACLDTRNLIEKNNLWAFGAGKDQTAALNPCIVELNGLSFAFIGSVGKPLKDMIWPHSRPGPAQASLAEICEGIIHIRQDVDFVVVSMHWGTEYEHMPRPHQIEWAHALIESGADLVIGHHPHVLQSIEIYKNRIILYSLGNFVFDQRKLYQRQTGIFSCIFKKGRIDSACFYPVLVNNFQPELARDQTYETIAQKITTISDKYLTVFHKKNDRLFMTDSSCRLYIDTPILRKKTGSTVVALKRTCIELYDSCGPVYDTLYLDPGQEIKDGCFIDGPDCDRIFVIISSGIKDSSDLIGQFRIDRAGIIPECCILDTRYRLWKILGADIDCDSIPEICIGARGSGTLADPANRLLVYSMRGSYPEQIYVSSGRIDPFIDFMFMDLDHDGLDDLLCFEPCSTDTYTLAVYQWLGFGFMKYHTLLTGLKHIPLRKTDLDQLLSKE
jgi:poly-gamma-glutamate capsule biosynthesis protein CapA/YwtB (metallophosphatase superfamily)